jgi:hypothetical protein
MYPKLLSNTVTKPKMCPVCLVAEKVAILRSVPPPAASALKTAELLQEICSCHLRKINLRVKYHYHMPDVTGPRNSMSHSTVQASLII